MKRNILLFILVLVITSATASYFGSLYDSFVPQQDNSLLGLPSDTVIFVAGIPFAYMFLIPFIFELFGIGNKKKWITWSLIPVTLFYLYDSAGLIYIPISASIIGFALAKLIRFIISKFHYSAPPTVMK